MYTQHHYEKTYLSASEQALQRFPALMNQVYLWMTLALVMTALSSLFVVQQPAILSLIFDSQYTFFGLIAAEFGLVWFLSSRIMRLSFPVAGLLFALYSILSGVTLSSIFLVYTAESIVSTFFVTAGMFAAMAVIGLWIKKDLSTIARFLIMAVIGLIIAQVVNIFVGNESLNSTIAYVGVLVFAGLTAYDTQKIRNLLVHYQNANRDSLMKISLMGSLALYLDFINMFIYLLRILGSRR